MSLSPALPPPALAPSGPSKGHSTSLIEWPEDATFQIHRKPVGGVTPVNGGTLHVGELLPGDGTYLLVCVEDLADYGAIGQVLRHGERLGVPVVMVGGGATDFIGSVLYSCGILTGLHGLTREPTRCTVFSPSATLSRLLRINPPNLSSRTKNALILIQDGRVRASWVSGGEGQDPHNWTEIEKALQSE